MSLLTPDWRTIILSLTFSSIQKSPCLVDFSSTSRTMIYRLTLHFQRSSKSSQKIKDSLWRAKMASSPLSSIVAGKSILRSLLLDVGPADRRPRPLWIFHIVRYMRSMPQNVTLILTAFIRYKQSFVEMPNFFEILVYQRQSNTYEQA